MFFLWCDSWSCSIGWTVVSLVSLYVAGVAFVMRGVGAPRKITSWQGRHVLITGGSAGLGKAFAEEVLKKGASVTIIARSEGKLNEAKHDLERLLKSGGKQRVVALSADVTNYQSIESAVKRAVNEIGAPDVVICNAGASRPGYFLEIPVEALQNEVTLNYLGCVYTAKATLPEMVRANNKGHITFISSAAAFLSFIGYTNYTATKMALKGLADGLRNEMQAYDIGVSIYYPTGIATEGFEQEEKTKPVETKIIEGPSSTLTPNQCAQALVKGFEQGRYSVYSEWFPTEVLRMSCHSMVTRDSFILDLLITPIVVLISPIFVWHHDHVVKSHKQLRKKNL